MSRTELPAAQAVILGLLHGPAELLPISSSGHITLIPWLAGWRYDELDPELRKSFEVALHAGTAAALLITQRGEITEAINKRRAALILLSFAPPAIAGLTLERQIERHLGTPATIAVGLIAGSVVMALADLFGAQTRPRDNAGALDGLLLGLGQACALIPGVSRNGATLAVARLRGFNRADANVLSRHCALPIIVGAVALKGRRLAGRGGTGGLESQFAAGAVAAFASTLYASKLIRRHERRRSFVPYAGYRIALAALVIRRLRENARP